MQVKIIKCHHLKEFLFWYDFALSTRKHIAHFPATIFIFIIFTPIFYCIRKTEYIHTCMLHICTCTYILNWQKTDKTYVYLTMRMICRNIISLLLTSLLLFPKLLQNNSILLISYASLRFYRYFFMLLHSTSNEWQMTWL